MNILTKICIVVLVVLVLVASTVFINQATSVPNYRQLWNNQKLETQAAQQTARTYQTAAAWANDQLTARSTDLRAAREAREREVRELQKELSRKEVQSASLQNELASLTRDVKDLRVVHQKTVEQRQQLEQRNTSLLEELDKVSNQARRLSDALKTCEGENERLTRANRFLKEQIAGFQDQIAEKNRRIEELQGQVAEGGAAPGDGEVGPTIQETDRKIIGTLTAVREGMASVNVGSAQGLEKGMELMIYRGANFIGYLRIKELDVNQAAGTIVDNVLDPMQGDRVASMAALK